MPLTARTLALAAAAAWAGCARADAGLDAAFSAGDRNGDGALDQGEFTAAVASMYVKAAAAGEVKPPGAAPAPLFSREPEDGYSAKFTKAFVNSMGMIWATEIGDKTFFIAAILAMRHSRLAIFAGALGALAVMTVLSAILGLALPALIPRKYTHYASAGLFLYFGLRLLNDAKGMEGAGVSEELEEVEEELGVGGKKSDAADAEAGGAGARKAAAAEKKALGIFTQAFTLTFLAEWGDRSQIATIALASAKDPYGVVAGGVVGHAMCTGLAVVGGRMLASRISEKHVAVVGGIIFLAFAVYSFLFEDPDA